ncbi:DUF397 domain-containing protein [Lentzea sp. NBRC 102530]|uniref:DUF397 domain-containing protein n=1 Tax=Lentzea sp. NBRC 102530 TaxID=3032201 RepID=UPI0024A0E76E|nr:DUF397 domain-containing protein [Lentzea sp. NBRC 102530]GLY52654.1 hypothetical protein Lesp01_63100 [Lentzea sp. NBRC 102530]
MSEWRKSSYSPEASDCVEVGHGVGIRDSKAPATHLPLSCEAWEAFLHLAKGSSASTTAS